MIDYIAGIDPGRTGSFCVHSVSKKEYQFQDIPYIQDEPDFKSMAAIFKEWCIIASNNLKVFLEKAQSMPGNGGAHMLKYGRAAGGIEGILAALKIPYELVPPSVWTKELHAGISKKLKPKAKSLLVATQLFPGIDFKRTERCKKPDEGRIDALLITEWGARKESGRLSKSS